MESAERAERLAAAIGHRFARPALLAEALTHPSAAHGRKGRRRKGAADDSYERLEFLGDRVLGLVVAELLWHRFPDEPEGHLTRRLTQLVRRETLAEVAAAAGLGDAVVIAAAAAEEETIRGNANLLADVCEAVIGALYLDGGLEAASRFVRKHWGTLVERARTPPKDPKTALQEWAQGRGGTLPVYETVAIDGPAHKRTFTVRASVDGMTPEEGRGPSKRAAQIAAARALLARLAEAAE